MTIIKKEGIEFDLNNYSCKHCVYIDNSRPWTGYGECDKYNMVVDLDNSCGSHSSIERKLKEKTHE